jgi:hypothetical protein
MALRFFSSRLLTFLPLAAALAVSAVSPAMAQEEEPNEIAKVLGAIGLLELPKDPIDYSERSPLVVPPSADLPKPGGDENVRALNPEWPVDQDLKRQRAAAKEAKKPIDQPNDLFYGGRLMQPGDWKQAKSKGGGEGPELWSDAAKQEMYRISPKELNFKGWNKKEEPVFTKEPSRTSLLQPPAGYQTPSPNAPYGIVEEEKVKTTQDNYDRGNIERTKQ